MASVDGSKSCLRGSDEVPTYQCGPCSDDGESKEANHYCEDCEEYLCNSCKEYHRKFKATKSHKIISGRLHPKHEYGSKIPAWRVTCNCNQISEVKVYCENHSDVVCTDCETLKHRKCVTCPLGEKVLNYKKNNFSLALNRANKLKSKIDQIKQMRGQDRQRFDTLKENCLKEIKDFRRQINTVLDKAEESVLEDLNSYSIKQDTEYEKDIATLDTTLNSVETDIRFLEDANGTDNDKILFAADIKASKNIRELDLLIQDLERDVKAPYIAFEENQRLSHMKAFTETLGTIKVIKGRHEEVQKSMLDMKVVDKQEIDITVPGDGELAGITGCVFIDGYVLLCDRLNKRLKLLDKAWKITETLTLKDSPWGLATTNDQTAVVTFPESRYFQNIQIFPELRTGDVIKLDFQCAGIEVVGDEIYTCTKGLGENKVWILDKTGRKKRTVNLSQNLNNSYYLSTRTTENDTHMYITDYKISSVTCQNIAGTIVYNYQDKTLKRANGIYVDSKGNAIVCGTDSNNVIIITSEGKKHRDLLTAEDGLHKPKSVAYRPGDNTLVVGCEGSAKLLVFTLSE